MNPFFLIAGILASAWLVRFVSEASGPAPSGEAPSGSGAAETMTRPSSAPAPSPTASSFEVYRDFVSWWESSPMGSGFPPSFFAKTPPWYVPESERAGNFLLGPPVFPPWRKKGGTKEEADRVFAEWLSTGDGRRFLAKWTELHPSKNPWKAILDHYLGA